MSYPILKNLSHPDAIVAVKLSVLLQGAPPNLITHVLSGARCPRSLFVLASVLRAASRPGAVS
jgi:hypothetical protein